MPDYRKSHVTHSHLFYIQHSPNIRYNHPHTGVRHALSRLCNYNLLDTYQARRRPQHAQTNPWGSARVQSTGTTDHATYRHRTHRMADFRDLSGDHRALHIYGTTQSLARTTCLRVGWPLCIVGAGYRGPLQYDPAREPDYPSHQAHATGLV